MNNFIFPEGGNYSDAPVDAPRPGALEPARIASLGGPQGAPAEIITIDVPGMPTAKGRPKFASIAGRARAYTPSKTRHYELKIAEQGAAIMAGRPLLNGALVMRVTARLPVPSAWSRKKRAAALAGLVRPITRPDVDNYAKIALDALNCVVFTDDSRVAELTASKVYSDMPGLRVEIAEL